MSSVIFQLDNCDGSEYVLLPSCAYNGNRFRSFKRKYPPMFRPSEVSVDMPITITDVPRLEPDGSGCIEITTGDLSTPCIGVYEKKADKATFLYTQQQIDGENIGIAYERGKITLSYPAFRRKIYTPYIGDCMQDNNETYIGKDAEIPYRKFEIECHSMAEFFDFYFTHRKLMYPHDQRASVRSDSELYEIEKNKFNRLNWTGEYYAINTDGTWKPGWVGGGMASYALMKLGGATEYARAVKTLEKLFSQQAESGLFYWTDGESGRFGDGFGTAGTARWLFIRASGDALYFAFQHFELMDKIPEAFINGARKLSERFCRIFEKYGQFGQFIDGDSGEIVVGGTSSGAIIPAALVMAYRFFKVQRYLETAKQSAEEMYRREAAKGYTTGGPGEALQCPDSESAFALLESMVLLYDETKEEKWLQYAEYAAKLCSTWVVSYNYLFPAQSEFSRLGIHTVGSVFANVQNKHAAPGIATLSGSSLDRLYQWTGNLLYKELYEDIAFSIGQYMSTQEKPIYAKYAKKYMPEGYVNERVNMSDWEGENRVGEVFYGSCCWCETALLLSLAYRMNKDEIRAAGACPRSGRE